jgi:hypothetical protein
VGRRLSHALPAKAGANLLDAWRFADQLRTPLNAFLTVHMAKLDGGGDPLQRQGRWREAMAKWLKARGVAPTWIWWRENGDLSSDHFHMLLHLPPKLRAKFGRMVRTAWVQDGEPGAIDGPKAASDGSSMIGYAVKDMTRADWLALELPSKLWSHYARKRSKRPIEGKRCGTSENIGDSVRWRYYRDHGIPISPPIRPAKGTKCPPRSLPGRYAGPQNPREAA